jgi:hypothetical protein
MAWGSRRDPIRLDYDSVAHHIRTARKWNKYQGCSYYDRDWKIVVRFDPADRSDNPRIQVWLYYSMEVMFGGRFHKSDPQFDRKNPARLRSTTPTAPPNGILTSDNWLIAVQPLRKNSPKWMAETCDMLTLKTVRGYTYVRSRHAYTDPWVLVDELIGFNTKTGEIQVYNRITEEQIHSAIPMWRDVDAEFRRNFVFIEKFFRMRDTMTGSIAHVDKISTRIFPRFRDRPWLVQHPDWATNPEVAIPPKYDRETNNGAAMPREYEWTGIMVAVVGLIDNRITDMSRWNTVASEIGWPSHSHRIVDLLEELRDPLQRVALIVAVETLRGRRGVI